MVRQATEYLKRVFHLDNMQGMDFPPNKLPSMLLVLDYSPCYTRLLHFKRSSNVTNKYLVREAVHWQMNQNWH